MDREVVVTEDVAGAAAERVAAVVRAGGHIALSGGSTPRKAHERVAALDLDWSRVDLWLGDERVVPPEHEHSNYRMARESLGDPVNLHRVETELGYEAAAASYERELRAAGPDRFDLILLGLGPDAHTASLFPGDDALGERERLVVGVETPGMAPLVSRVTLTLPVLNAGKEVVFLISGEDKAEAVARAFGDAAGPDAPASLVRPESGLTVLVDPPAAARLGAAG
jgi:6-phosphogluconolactonase